MGRKHRSSSLGGAPAALLTSPSAATFGSAATTAGASSSTTTAAARLPECLAATGVLFERFVLGLGDGGGGDDGGGVVVATAPFRRLIHAAARAPYGFGGGTPHDDGSGDALLLLEATCSRARESDRLGRPSSAAANGDANVGGDTAAARGRGDGGDGLLCRLLLSRDVESGFTPLHVAVYHRDPTTTLLLLGHGASPNDDDVLPSSSGIASNIHPLQLLDDDDDRGNVCAITGGTGTLRPTSLLAAMARSTDREGLTPLRLLGRTSEGDLGRCRMSLSFSSSSPVTSYSFRGRGLVVEDGDGNEDDAAHEGGGGEGRERRKSGRSGSFNVVDTDNDYHEEADYDDDDRSMPRNDGHFNVDFGILGGEVDREGGNYDEGDDEPFGQRKNGPHAPSNGSTSDDYGCEVLTFGRADHCALGVPGCGGGGGGLTTMGSSTGCHKPRRVEAFGLGELRRKWSSSTTTTRRTTSSNDPRSDDEVDSPAVAVAASTHHTLVLTRTGRLFAFGYGKSGRLGVGDSRNRNLPVRVLGQLTRRVVTGVAAAEDHSLCCTSDGEIFAWGSNGFGQLGHPSSTGRGSGADRDDDAVTAGRLSPRRVEGGGLRQSFVVAVAAGDRHSVALTKLGEVFCWGDNRSGQLGIFSNNGDVGSGSSPASSGRCSHSPQRVEGGLWSARPRRRAIAIAAAEFSTLVLTMPPTAVGGGYPASLASLPVNTVYGWGHGNHSVMRVVFPSATAEGNGSHRHASVYARSICINPTVIACAKYHNVAITADGAVYTWGLQRDCLGIEKSTTAVGTPAKRGDSEWATASEGRRPRSNSNGGLGSNAPSSLSVISSPQLVVGLLPENGGGKAVAVSASVSHTAVLTSDGHLFTWGTSIENDVLGHKGVKWLQCPRKVKRVHRAVGVVAAKEHTVLLMATTFPPLPAAASMRFGLSTCNVDDRNRQKLLSLQECTAVEISRNVDLFNVLPIATVSLRLNCRPLMSFCDEFIRKNLDGVMAVGNKNDFATFISSSMQGRSALVGGIRNNFDLDGLFHPFFYHLAYSRIEDSCVLLEKYAGSIVPQRKKIKRRLIREEQRLNTSICIEKDSVEADECKQKCVIPNVVVKKLALSSDKKSVRVLFLDENDDDQLQLRVKLFAEKAESKATCVVDDTPRFRCEACNILCPDGDSFTLHMNGRKHRNCLMHAKAKEEKLVAETMMEMKRMQLMEKNCSGCKSHDDAVSKDQRMKTVNRPLDMKTRKTAWAGNAASPITASVRKERSTSFQEILNEEQQRSWKDTLKTKGMLSTPVVTKQPTLSRTSTAMYPTHAPSKVDHNAKIFSPITISGQTLLLSAFIKESGDRKVVDTAGSHGSILGTKSFARKTSGALGWGAKPDYTVRPHHTAKSFSAIQQEEEAIRSNEDHMCRIEGNQWFVPQRERAASIGEIQEQEKKNKEMHDLIEEQKQIERDIIEKAKQEKRNIHIKKRKTHQKRPVTNSGNAKCDRHLMP